MTTCWAARTRRTRAALLLYQIVPGAHTPESLKGKAVTINTLQKDPVTIDGTGEAIRYGGDFGATQSGAAITASNGIVIPVDSLPTPVFSQSDDSAAVPPAHEGLAPSSGTLTPPPAKTDL